jgi:amino acid permease
MLQLFIFALLFAGFGVFSVLKKKRFVGITFILLGIMLFAIATIVVYMYPHTRPFK